MNVRPRRRSVEIAASFRPTRILIVLAIVAAHLPAAWAEPTLSEVLTAVGFPEDAQQRILAGELVTSNLKAVSERDLSIAMGFLVKTSPDDLLKQLLAGDLAKVDDQQTARGDIHGAGAADDFAAAHLNPGGAAVAKTFANASPGDKLNLAADEIKAFNALKGESDLTKAIEQQFQKMLLSRYQAYRAAGLAGIPGYERGGKSSDPAADLRSASEAPILKELFPAFQRALANYPNAKMPSGSESFFWVNNKVDDLPTFALTHLLTGTEGAARIVIQRQFYVSRSYNGQQAIAGFFAVPQGTLVVYTSHTFTDQVSGIGGATKQGIGRRVMAGKLKEIFEKQRKAAAAL